MEPLSEIARRTGLITTGESSVRQLSDAESSELTGLLDQTAAHYPHQQLAMETGEVWREAYQILARKFTVRRVRSVLADFLIKPGQKFFPHPSEAAEALEELVAKEAAEVGRRVKYTPCGRCFSGQVFVDRQGQPVQPNGSLKQQVFSRDCQCMLDWKRTLTAAQKVVA